MTSLRDVPSDQLFCLAGGFNHQWEAINKPVKAGAWGRRRNDRCVRCGKERITIRNIHERTAARWYDTPTWHVKVTVPYDSYDVSEEISRRLRNNEMPKKSHGRKLRAV